MRKRDYQAAVEMVRGMSKGKDPSYIMPLPEDQKQFTRKQVEGMAIWQTREAFVTLFSRDPNFDADAFRVDCLLFG